MLVLLVAADQITKLLIASSYDVGESTDIISGIIRLTYVRNRGAAFGMLANQRWIFLVLTTLTIAAIVWYIIKYRPRNKLVMGSLTLILAGGIGNMIDRIRLEYVIDFIDFYAFGEAWKWVFNVADACVCIGAGLMILYLILEMARESKEKTAAASEVPAGSADSGESNTDERKDD